MAPCDSRKRSALCASRATVVSSQADSSGRRAGRGPDFSHTAVSSSQQIESDRVVHNVDCLIR